MMNTRKCNWIHRMTLDVLFSVREDNLPDLVQNYIRDPDLSQVSGLPRRYWKIIGDAVQPMTVPERQVVDAAEHEAYNTYVVDKFMDDPSALKAFALVMLDEVNVLRAQLSLPERTPAQLKAAVRARME